MSMNTKLVLPVALGLSLVTVTAFVVYYVFKKEEEDGEGKAIKTSRVNIIEVNVPKSIVPALIGRNGSNIKEIEKNSGALIHFKKFSDKEYDVCIIRGRSETTQLAETLIHDFISQQPVIEEDSITVPGWACGRIIGQGGESINDISHRSGARVKVEGQPGADRSTQRQVSFRGTRQQIDMAKGLVENCVAQEKCRREIDQSRRSPRHNQSQSRGMSQSPSPTPSLNASEGSEDPPGDSLRHARHRRPEGTGPIEVYVSAVSSPSRFWVQLVGPQVAQLDELVETMTEYYGKKENREAHVLSRVTVGQLVAAVFRHDGRWYRARVTDIRPNEFDATQQVADVFYLDYGDSEYVATHELCELRTDMLRLRFQAMECFLAGVKPAGREEDTVAVGSAGQRWDKWHPHAVERFEELTQVARWKALLSRTSTYRKSSAIEGGKEKEIPGMKLFDVTDEGEVDIAAVLISEGWAAAAAAAQPDPPRALARPFGDLGNSKVLSMTEPCETNRCASLPKDDGSDVRNNNDDKDDKMAISKSLASGLEKDKPLSISNFDLSYPDPAQTKPHLNGSHDEFINKERLSVETEGSSETLVPPVQSTPNLGKTERDEFKANMNRIESHHSNLESLGKSQVDLHDKTAVSKSLASGLETDKPLPETNAHLTYHDPDEVFLIKYKHQ